MKFTHKYDKLEGKVFPTVRSIKYMEKHDLSIGSVDDVYIGKDLVGTAVLIAEQRRQISDMHLSFLKYDSNYDYEEIESHQDYVELLNSFIPYKSNRLGTTKSILWWVWKSRVLPIEDAVPVLNEIISYLGAQ